MAAQSSNFFSLQHDMARPNGCEKENGKWKMEKGKRVALQIH
jgi:hypothetical protein